MKQIISLIFLSCLIAACSSTPTQHEPEWVHQATRTVDNGYIVYIGRGEGPNPDKASFRAEGLALEDLANECSMIPKGTRTEDRYVEKTQFGSTAYVKVALEFQECQEAQKATDPVVIKKLANVAYTGQLKKYQDFEETGSVPDKGGGASIEPPVEFVKAPSRESSWSDSTHFYVTRQYVVYQKELVILSPPQSYAPGSVENQRFQAAVLPATQNLASLETKDPSLAKQPRPWSEIKERPHLTLPLGLAPRNSVHPAQALTVPEKPSSHLRSAHSKSAHVVQPHIGARKKRKKHG